MSTMPDARKRPCCICRRWFRPHPRVGSRQRACANPDCQSARRRKQQKSWRARNPDYFRARRILDRSQDDRTPEPLRLPPPLHRLPWDIAQSQFGVQGADFIGLLGGLLVRHAHSQFEAYLIDSTRLAGTLPPSSAQSQIPSIAELLPVRTTEHETGISSAGPPL